jgi:hypothetical protein
VNVAPSSHVLRPAFGICPSRSTPGCEPCFPCGPRSLRPRFYRNEVHTREHLTHLWVPATPANARSRGRLVPSRDSSPTGRVCLSRLFSWLAPANRVSGWIVLGHPPFRGFSPFAPPRRHTPAEAGYLRRDFPPCRFPPRRRPPAVKQTARCAMPRLRGFELDCHEPASLLAPWLSERMRSPATALFTPPTGRSSLGRYPPSRMTSRPRPVTSAGLLSWASIMLARLLPPCGDRRPTGTCALQSIRDPEALARCYTCPPPWGFRLGVPTP